MPADIGLETCVLVRELCELLPSSSPSPEVVLGGRRRVRRGGVGTVPNSTTSIGGGGLEETDVAPKIEPPLATAGSDAGSGAGLSECTDGVRLNSTVGDGGSSLVTRVSVGTTIGGSSLGVTGWSRGDRLPM